MMENWGIHWFRRDLRIAGNQALQKNWKQTSGRVLGLFCFDAKFLKRSDFSHHRFAFFLKTLKEMKSEFQKQGGDLLVVDSCADEAFEKIFLTLNKTKKKLPTFISWNRDYEPFARNRDQKIESLLKKYTIEHITERDHLLIEPWEIQKDDGSFYQIYSPFARRWFEKLKTPDVQNRLHSQLKIKEYWKNLQTKKNEKVFQLQWSDLYSTDNIPFKDQLDFFMSANQKSVNIVIPEAGFKKAFEDLMSFRDKIHDYKTNRDLPFLEGTSKLSLYHKNGSIVSSQVIAMLTLQNHDWKEKNGPAHFLKEIAWREFYYSILYHRPDVENKSFLPQYENLNWENNEMWFKRWCEGTTGFPIVDAGMRELNTTGWMHNRVRMIVASFLTKDLLIDWRLGENYFMQMLLDGDLAPNNGGWQWAASTGCDPQPYFRIFNPWLQSAKFDPDALYIKKFVPELADVSIENIHHPEGDRIKNGYPKPIVDHREQKEKALKLFSGAIKK